MLGTFRLLKCKIKIITIKHFLTAMAPSNYIPICKAEISGLLEALQAGRINSQMNSRVGSNLLKYVLPLPPYFTLLTNF